MSKAMQKIRPCDGKLLAFSIVLAISAGCRSTDSDEITDSQVAPQHVANETVASSDDSRQDDSIAVGVEDGAQLTSDTVAGATPKSMTLSAQHCRNLSTTMVTVKVDKKLHTGRLSCRTFDTWRFSTADGISCLVKKGSCQIGNGRETVIATCGNRRMTARINCSSK